MKIHLNNKVFLSFVLSYVLVLMIPYSIGYFVYDQSIVMLSDKINEVESVTMESRVEVIDDKIEGVRTLLMQLANDNDLATFVNYYDPFRSDNAYYAMTQLKSLLSSMILDNPSLLNITIHSTKYSRMMSSDYGTVYNAKSDFPYETLWGISEEDYLTMTDQKEQAYFLLTGLDGETTLVFLVMPVIISDVGQPEGVIIAQLKDFETIMSLGESDHGESSFFIVDEQGKVLSNDPEDSRWLMVEEVELEATAITLSQGEYIRREHGELQMTYRKSSVNNWVYVSIVDMNSFLKDVNDYKRSVVIFVVISALLGIIIALYVSQMKYKPIKRLRMMASEYKGSGEASDYDDYKMIEASIDNMMQAVDGYKLHLMKQERKNTSWYFSRIIKGWHVDIDSDYDSEELKLIKSTIDTSTNRVLIYQIDDFTEKFYESGMDLTQESTWPLVSFIIINVLEEFYSSMGALHVMSVDNDNRYVIPVKIGDIQEREFVEKSKAIKEFLMTKFGIVGTVGISLTHQGKEGIKQGYEEALEVIEFKNIIGEQNTVATYDHLLNEKGNRKLMFGIEKEKVFVNFILIEDFASAKKTINSIIDEEFACLKSLQILKVKLFGMIDKMMYGLMSLSEKSAYYGTLDQQQIEGLLNAKNVPELKNNIDIIFNQLLTISESVQDTQDRIQEILDYINANINDPDLNVSMIAEAFDMTVSNLSKYMKKSLGVPPLDHIHLLRIGQAKELLKSTELTLKDISDCVGYYNYRTLVSRFKKYEGVTPTQFREQI